MERVRFCRHCGELLEEKWLHCPWCGRETSPSAKEWGEALEDSIDRAEQELIKGRMVRLDDISCRLDALESELDEFLDARVRQKG
jgi:uncharacterized membrane protein YvbJ